MRKIAEDETDIANTEAWAKVFHDILDLIPGDHVELLALVTKNDEAERAEKAKTGGWLMVNAGAVDLDPGYWNAAMRLRSLIVQVFARRITNNHSKPDAAAILFAEHPYGHGSRCLSDYLPPEPGARVPTR
jgi:hypothetical protein